MFKLQSPYWHSQLYNILCQCYPIPKILDACNVGIFYKIKLILLMIFIPKCFDGSIYIYIYICVCVYVCVYIYHHRHHHHPVVCLTTVSKPRPKRSLHILRFRASSFKWEYPLLSLRSPSGFLRLLPCLLVTSISPFIFPSITCFRRQFLRKMFPIQLVFRFLIECRIFLCSLTWSNTS